MSRGVKRSASTIEFRFGCDVRPDMRARARSTMSTSASAALSTAAGLHAAGVVRVEVDRDADFAACSVLTSFSAA